MSIKWSSNSNKVESVSEYPSMRDIGLHGYPIMNEYESSDISCPVDVDAMEAENSGSHDFVLARTYSPTLMIHALV